MKQIEMHIEWLKHNTLVIWWFYTSKFVI